MIIEDFKVVLDDTEFDDGYVTVTVEETHTAAQLKLTPFLIS